MLESTTDIIVGMGIREFESLKRYMPILELDLNLMNKNSSSNKIYEVSKKFMKDLATQEKKLLQE